MENFNVQKFSKTLFEINQLAKNYFETYVMTSGGTILPIRFGRWENVCRPFGKTEFIEEIYSTLRIVNDNEVFMSNSEGIYRGLKKSTKVVSVFTDKDNVVWARVEKDKDIDNYIKKMGDAATMFIKPYGPTNYDVTIGAIIDIEEHGRLPFITKYINELDLSHEGLEIHPPRYTYNIEPDIVRDIYDKKHVLLRSKDDGRSILVGKPLFKGISARSNLYLTTSDKAESVFNAYFQLSKTKWIDIHMKFIVMDMQS